TVVYLSLSLQTVVYLSLCPADSGVSCSVSLQTVVYLSLCPCRQCRRNSAAWRTQQGELATLQRQQATHDQEKRRREREWEVREQQLTDREVQLLVQEEETGRRSRELDTERVALQRKKKDYLIDLERLRDAQKKLDRDREHIHREMERVEHMRMAKRWIQRTPSSTSDDSSHFPSSTSLDKDPMDPTELSSSPRKDSPTSTKGKSLNPFSEAPALKAPSGDSQNQIDD
ncbi:A-kinase anchor protein 13-like, partial [Salvelinus sp. IW2-2015]|uniref:A-kinase anchor protein 13-like n=1 Tax=Salvelinus sp. IW2-2015 TaxID=2691554 RepID=UPI0038D416D7